MKNSWISIEDRLPDNEDYRLVYTSSGDFDLAWYSQIHKKWYWNSFDTVDACGMNRVVYWQPLKAPSKRR